MIVVSRKNYERRIIPDPHTDEAVGVRATVELKIPYGEAAICHRITTPGLWAVESDSPAGYLDEVYRAECDILEYMLRELGSGITIVD